MTSSETGGDTAASRDSSDGPHTSDEPVGAEEDLGVQVQAEGHDFEDPQTELLAAQEEGGLDLLKVAQRT